MISAFPPTLEAFVSNEIALGEYTSKDELVCEAVRVLHALENRRLALRRHIQEGVDQLDCGEGIALDGVDALNSFFDDIQRRGWERQFKSPGGLAAD